MKRVRIVCLLLSFWAGAALAQSSNGYGFFGFGVSDAYLGGPQVLYYGGGGEAILGKIVGAGGELGARTWPHFHRTYGLASANGYVHFTANRRPRFDPFVTGGYTLQFRNGHANLVNFGCGLNYWFRNTLGIRIELRDHMLRASHLVALRLGISFRSGGN
jgi:hypothetical protein